MLQSNFHSQDFLPRGRGRLRAGASLVKLGVLLVVIGGASVAGYLLLSGGDGAEGASEQIVFAEVSSEPMVISLTEDCEVVAKRKTQIRNELRWPVYIEFVREKGPVKSGQRVLKLRCDELMQEIAQQEVQLANNRSAYEQANEDLSQKQKEVENAVRKAAWEFEKAQLDLLTYEQIEWPIKLKDKIDQIRMQKGKLKLARESLEFKIDVNRKLKENSPYSPSEIENDRLGVESMQVALDKMIAEKDKLLQFDHPKELKTKIMAVEDTELAYLRAELDAKGEMVKAESNLLAKKTTLMRTEQEYAELTKMRDEQLEYFAEEDGIVVWETGNRWNPVTVGEGERIDRGRPILSIPDLTSLYIETSVYEAYQQRIQSGQEAFIRLKRDPETVIRGKVREIAPLSNDKNRWLNPGVKTFNVEVDLVDNVPDLRPELTGKMEIILERVPKTLSVPIAAVFSEGENYYCYVQRDGRTVKAPVRRGRTNDKRVEIVEGLTAGELVALAEPETWVAGPDLPPLPETERPGDADKPAGPAVAEKPKRDKPARSGSGTTGQRSDQRDRPPRRLR